MKRQATANKQQTIRGDRHSPSPRFALSRSRVLVIVSVLIGLAVPCLADHFDDTMRQVRKLSDSANVRLLQFGRSSQGRPIPAFIVSDFSVDSKNKARLLVIAGQHGDEYNPVRAILSLSQNLAAGSRNDLTQRCVVIVVPMTNPDGIAANNRLNSNGADINRDWLTRATREARFVHSIVKAWRPQAIIDAHEWTGPAPICEDSVELPACSAQPRRAAMASIAKGIAHASGLTLIRDSSSSDDRLFHRRYSAMGYAAYLVETAQGADYAIKARAYEEAVEQVAESITSDSKLRSEISPSSTAFNMAGVSAYLDPPAGPFADPESSALAFAATALAVYCLMIWVLKPLATENETMWSRKFRKCSVDWDIESHPLSKRRPLQPLTSRSWAHRRLRTRYAPTHGLVP